MPDRVAFETARLELARLRVKPGSDDDVSLQTALRLCARTLKVDRVGYWVFTAGDSALECRLQYTMSSDEYAGGDVLLATRYPSYWQALREKRVIAVADAIASPHTRELAASYLKPLGIGAMMDAPVFRAGELIGVVCHEHVGPARAWSDDEVHFASAVGDLVSMTLEQGDRITAENKLRAYVGEALAAEQLAVMEGLCRAIAHDFANLFAVVELAAGSLPSLSGKPDKVDEVVAGLRSVAQIGSDLLGQMRRFGDRHASPGAWLPLRRIVERVVPILGTLTRDVATVEVALELGDDDVADVSADRIEQLILNLILNARDAIATHGRIDIRGSRDGDQLVLEVADDGVGMTPDVLARIWEPYFTTKNHGTGLGLATVRAIVDEVGGTIAVTSAPGQGTRFAVRLPART
jgi:two-component system, cell cycle sensor histidine kinase and response regulator CckA